MSEQTAVNLIDEAKAAFLDAMMQLDEDLAKKLSLYDFDRIFQAMVIPAIERVRHIERFKDEPHLIKPPLMTEQDSIRHIMNTINNR